MKTIKVILVIISLMVVAFLATGFLIKETTYTVKVTINKPLNEVFTSFTNIDNSKNWMPEIQEIETINKNLGITGSTYKLKILNQEQPIFVTERIMAYVPKEKYTVFMDAENMLTKYDYLFSEENDKTTIELNARRQSETYLMGCMFPFFKGNFITQDQMILNNFKDFIEKD